MRHYTLNRIRMLCWADKGIGDIRLISKETNMRSPFSCSDKTEQNSFVMTPSKWIKSTNAIGIKSKAGKYGGGTYAHRDIALEFASWISPEIKLYIIKEFQRLKSLESDKLEWQGQRLIVKLNYLINTEAISKYLITVNLTTEQKNEIYASEADILNVALFGMTAKQWRESNSNKDGNIRDYASTIELSILSNLEFYNSKLIEENIPPKTRLIILNNEANKEKELFDAMERDNWMTPVQAKEFGLIDKVLERHEAAK